MVSEVSLGSEDVAFQVIENEVSFPTIAQALTQVVEELFKSCGNEPAIQLDPARVTNAAAFVIEQIETIQLVEKLFLASKIQGADNETVKGLLLQMKDRPEGVISIGVINLMFSDMVDVGNIELMDFILAEFGNYLDLDGWDVAESVTVYAQAGEEEKAIQMLGRTEGEVSECKLKELLPFVESSKMDNLSREIRDRLSALNDSDVAL